MAVAPTNPACGCQRELERAVMGEQKTQPIAVALTNPENEHECHRVVVSEHKTQPKAMAPTIPGRQ